MAILSAASRALWMRVGSLRVATLLIDTASQLMLGLRGRASGLSVRLLALKVKSTGGVSKFVMIFETVKVAMSV